MYVLVTFCEVVPSIDILESFFIGRIPVSAGETDNLRAAFLTVILECATMIVIVL